MSAEVTSQKQYLQRYLSKNTDGKKKKRKKHNNLSALKRSLIIDDDMDLKNMRPIGEGDLDLYQVGEDAPQIAGIIDERPPELRAQDYYSDTKRWKVIADENCDDITVTDNHEEKLQQTQNLVTNGLIPLSNVKKIATKKETREIEHQIDLETRLHYNVHNPTVSGNDKKSVLDQGVQNLKNVKVPKSSSKKPESDYDLSLPCKSAIGSVQKRRKEHSESKKGYRKVDSDSDLCPPNISRKEPKNKPNSDSDKSPPRKKHVKNEFKTRHHKYDSHSDLSPSRKKYDSDTSPPQKKYDSDSDLSPLRKKYDSDSDLPPPRKLNEENMKKRQDHKWETSTSESGKMKYLKTSNTKKSYDSDLSPPRKSTIPSNTIIKKRNASSGITSPFNTTSKSNTKNLNDCIDSDSSPTCKLHSKNYKNQKRSDFFSIKESKAHIRKDDRDAVLACNRDESIKAKKRKKKCESNVLSPHKVDVKRNHRSDTFVDDSDVRQTKKAMKESQIHKHSSDSDLSPTRKSSRDSKHRSHKWESDSDSPTRTVSQKSNIRYGKHDRDADLQRHKKSIDQSNSISRKQDTATYSESSAKRKDFDRSIKECVQKHREEDKAMYLKNCKQDAMYNSASPKKPHSSKNHKHNSDSDLTPPRRSTNPSQHASVDDSSHRSSKMKKTLDGKRAGLQNAMGLREELTKFKNEESKAFDQMNPSVSGKGAAPVMRNRKTGKKRDLEQEKEEAEDKSKKTAIHKEKYDKWGKGLKQVADAKEKLADAIYEMSKPLARYADDNDLESFLRDQERDGDPMLEYIRSKKNKDSGGASSKPAYKGSFMPNRYGIRPGHQWDGVDRSNGFEKKWFESQNARKARDEEAYKWSSSDM